MPNLVNILSAVALVCSIFGNVLINFKKKVGYLIWILSNLFWIWINLLYEAPNYFQIVMFVVYIGLNIMGFIQWSAKSKNIDNQNK